MKILAFLAALAFALPALAQTAVPPPGGDPMTRALQMTADELKQAWIGARAVLLETQDKLTIANQKIANLEAKLPRQEPIRSPSEPAPASEMSK